MYQFLSTIFKIAVTSLIVGVVLSAIDITAADLLSKIGLTPESLWQHIQTGVTWAIPNIILGSLIVVPVWIVIYLFRPPRA
ncbi:DUF6460 domain-containing protein [Roseibium sp.]|uniref:DUF6460 domain-containing protein n=1 Tax=Roseibium sp. TaxID=1936156 RepID=UPI003265CD23